LRPISWTSGPLAAYLEVFDPGIPRFPQEKFPRGLGGEHRSYLFPTNLPRIGIVPEDLVSILEPLRLGMSTPKAVRILALTALKNTAEALVMKKRILSYRP